MLAFRKVWGVFLETARFGGKRGVAARGLAEALRSEALQTSEGERTRKLFFLRRAAKASAKARALKTREDRKKRKFWGGARREATARQGNERIFATPKSRPNPEGALQNPLSRILRRVP